MSLELADRSIQYPREIVEDVLIKIDKFFLPIDFVILDMREDSRIMIILGRPFLATARAMIDVFNKNITLRVGSEEVIFDINQSMKKPRTEDDKYFIEIFMDDFSVFGNSFDQCLNNLDKMLGRCEETNLVLNWEKCHFMVKEGVLLGHKIHGKGIKVDKAKIDVIAKLPYPTNIKGVRSFLGHAGFYRRFIKDFSMISKPMTQLLMKDAKFDLSEDLGAVLGQRIDGKFKPIYYASKTLNDAQAHYTTTEKELLAVVFSFDKFCPYLILSKTIVYTDHSALKYLFSKQDTKPRLIRWVLLLQGFNIEIKDKKGVENLVADHLSRLENPNIRKLAE
ncbi:reverse transcriptase domain-containing protein [Tanacetum coccineum]